MGFKWAVFIAHSISEAYIKNAITLFKKKRALEIGMKLTRFLLGHLTPITKLNYRDVFILHIIDDVKAITYDWADNDVNSLHALFRLDFLKLVSLPTHRSHSPLAWSIKTQ